MLPSIVIRGLRRVYVACAPRIRTDRDEWLGPSRVRVSRDGAYNAGATTGSIQHSEGWLSMMTLMTPNADHQAQTCSLRGFVA